MKEVMLFWIIGSVVGLYSTFVVQNLWNWFVTAAFHVSEISFWMMYGLVLFVGLFTSTEGRNFTEEQRWKAMLTAVSACIPDAKHAAVVGPV